MVSAIWMVLFGMIGAIAGFLDEQEWQDAFVWGLSGMILGGVLPSLLHFFASAPIPGHTDSNPEDELPTKETEEEEFVELSALDAKLLNAAFEGDVEAIRDLLAQGANPDATTSDGFSARIVGAQSSHQKVRELFDAPDE